MERESGRVGDMESGNGGAMGNRRLGIQADLDAVSRLSRPYTKLGTGAHYVFTIPNV